MSKERTLAPVEQGPGMGYKRLINMDYSKARGSVVIRLLFSQRDRQKWGKGGSEQSNSLRALFYDRCLHQKKNLYPHQK